MFINSYEQQDIQNCRKQHVYVKEMCILTDIVRKNSDKIPF